MKQQPVYIMHLKTAVLMLNEPFGHFRDGQKWNMHSSVTYAVTMLAINLKNFCDYSSRSLKSDCWTANLSI